MAILFVEKETSFSVKTNQHVVGPSGKGLKHLKKVPEVRSWFLSMEKNLVWEEKNPPCMPTKFSTEISHCLIVVNSSYLKHGYQKGKYHYIKCQTDMPLVM